MDYSSKKNSMRALDRRALRNIDRTFDDELISIAWKRRLHERRHQEQERLRIKRLNQEILKTEEQEAIQMRRFASLTREQEIEAAKDARRREAARKRLERQLDREHERKLQEREARNERKKHIARMDQHKKWRCRIQKLEQDYHSKRSGEVMYGVDRISLRINFNTECRSKKLAANNKTAASASSTNP
jgi:hypothetical protein